MQGSGEGTVIIRRVGAVAALGLAASAGLHVLWLYSPWPLANWADWSHAFGGPGFRVPAHVMIAVAFLFGCAAYLVGARATLVPQLGPTWLYRVGTWVVAVVLLGRAAVGFVEMSFTFFDPRTPAVFRETILLYLRFYLPVFLLLGALTAFVAVTAPRHVRSDSAPTSD